MKKVLVILLAIVPMLVNADAVEIDGIYYILDTQIKLAEVTSNPTKYSNTIVIPEVVDYEGVKYRVKRIGDFAFQNNTDLLSVTIPNSVWRIGSGAFFGCNRLIGITIPKSVTYIGEHAIEGCTSLETIVVEVENNKYDSRDNCNAIIETSTNTLILGCKNSTIPNNVTNIGNRAFRDCEIRKITIPGSVTTIGEGAFSGCRHLTSINFPSSLKTIGEDSFSDCYELKSLYIPSSVSSIGDNAFNDCGDLEDIKVDAENKFYDSRKDCNAIIQTSTNTILRGCQNTIIPNDVTTIGEYAFSGFNGLTSIDIPNSIISIGNGAFSNSALTSITIPSSVTCINYETFLGCKNLTSIHIPNSVNKIESKAFWWCSNLTSIDIPNSVTSIERETFYHCIKLESANIPNSITSIKYSAFRDCRALTSITIPNSVIMIDSNAFSGCTGLNSIICEITNPFEISENVFSSISYSEGVLTVPAGTKAKYQSTKYWNKFTNIVEDGANSITNSFLNTSQFNVYDLNGNKLKSRVSSLDGLQRGIYIIDGKKVIK